MIWAYHIGSQNDTIINISIATSGNIFDIWLEFIQKGSDNQIKICQGLL